MNIYNRIKILFVFLFISVNILATEYMKIGETLNLYFPTSITSLTLAGQPACTSSRPSEIQIISSSYSSVTIKALKAFTGSPCIIHVVYYYYVKNGSYIYQRSGYHDFYVEVSLTKPESVSIPSSTQIYTGESITLTPDVFPSDAITTFSWYSSNPNVATVNSSGIVEGKTEGETCITVETSNGCKDYCIVSVLDSSPTSVEIPSTLSINIDESTKLSPTLLPNYANSSFIWWSENPNIATVSSTGFVKGISEGTTKIWVQTTKGGCTDYSNVSVTMPRFILLKTSPIDNCKDFATNEQLIIDFSLQLYPSYNYNTIKLKKTETNEIVPGTVSISGKQLFFTPDKQLESNTDFTLTIPANALKNKWEDNYTQIIKIHFKTEIHPKDISYLYIWNIDGTNTTIALDEQPQIISDIEKEEVYCITSKQLFSFPLKYIHKYTLGIKPKATATNPIKELGESLHMKSNLLYFNNLTPYSLIRVFTINGIMKEEYQINKNGSIIIDINKWNKGIYIIKTKSTNYKIIKK